MSGVLVGLVLGLGLFCVWWSWWPPSPRRPSRRRGVVLRLSDDLAQAGVESVSPRALISTCATLFALVALATSLVSHVPAIGICFGVMAGWAPLTLVRSRARRRRAALRDVWPDAVDNLSSAVRAGLSLPEGLAQLAVRGPAELRPAFAAFAQDYRATGRFFDCLDRLKDRLADPVADRLVESLSIAREVGGSHHGRLLRTH